MSGEKKMGCKLLLLRELREYSENLVELWKGVSYGVGVGGNDADDRAQKQQQRKGIAK